MNKSRPRTDKELVEIYRKELKETYDSIYILFEKISDLEKLLETMGIITPKEYEEHKRQYIKQFPEQNISVLVRELRETTGEGMMDCKRALMDNNYDIDKAEKWLKETSWQRRKLI